MTTGNDSRGEASTNGKREPSATDGEREPSATAMSEISDDELVEILLTAVKNCTRPERLQAMWKWKGGQGTLPDLQTFQSQHPRMADTLKELSPDQRQSISAAFHRRAQAYRKAAGNCAFLLDRETHTRRYVVDEGMADAVKVIDRFLGTEFSSLDTIHKRLQSLASAPEGQAVTESGSKPNEPENSRVESAVPTWRLLSLLELERSLVEHERSLAEHERSLSAAARDGTSCDTIKPQDALPTASKFDDIPLTDVHDSEITDDDGFVFVENEE